MYFSKTNKSIFCSLIFFYAFCVSSVASAETVRPFIIGGLAFGGDTLISTSGEDLDAGGFPYFGGGAIFQPANSALMFQFSIGYKFDTVDFVTPNGGISLPGFGFVPGGWSGDGSISTIPLDAIAFFKVDTLRFGAGLSYFLNPKYKLCVDGIGCSTTNFDDSLGLVLEFRHQFTDILFWGARYTDVTYDIGSDSVDASNLRIHVGMVF